jgi:hypothetical protein
MQEKEKEKKKKEIEDKEKAAMLLKAFEDGLLDFHYKGTGELIDSENLHVTIETEKEQKQKESYLQYLELQKQIEELEKYRNQHKKPKEEQFVQLMPKFEEEILVKYKKGMIECLFNTVPYIHYNSNNFDNQDRIIRIDGQPATRKALAELWNVNQKKANKYIKTFVEDGIWEERKMPGYQGYVYHFNSDHILKGVKFDDEKTKKVIIEKLSDVITKINEQVELIRNSASNPFATDEIKKYAKLKTFHPLALLVVLMSKVNYQTFFPLRNHTKPILRRKGETVDEVLNSPWKRKRINFLSHKELWNLYSGEKIKANLSGGRNAELQACLYVLKTVKAIGIWETDDSYIILNPSLVFVSLDFKCDDDWKNNILGLFGLNKKDHKNEPNN